MKHFSFPLVEGADWWPDRFNLTATLLDEALRIEFLLSHKVGRCNDPRSPENEIFCWKFNYALDFWHKIMVTSPEQARADFWDLLVEVNFTLTVDDKIIQSAIEHIGLFFMHKISFDYPGRKKIPMILPIKDINRVLLPDTKLNFDWLNYMNGAFFERSQPTSGDEEILIEDSEVFSHSMWMIENTAPRIMSDVMMLGYMFGFQHMYVVYPFTRLDSFKRGTRKDYQRFEQCINHLESYFSPGLLGVYATKFYKKETQEAAESLIKEAVSDVGAEISKADDLDEDIKADAISRLQNVFIVAGYPEEITNAAKIEEMYRDIDLNGHDNILKTTISMIKYNHKLDNEPKTSWMSNVNQLTRLNNMKYLTEENVLYVPAEYIHHPYFDPNRSRFFNTATLFTEVVLALNEGIKDYIKQVSAI